jgi:hypothetical protein
MKPWEEQPWVDSYRLALIETNAAKMPDRIETAKSAIKSRIEALGRFVYGAAERGALMDALNALRSLTQEGTRLKKGGAPPESPEVLDLLLPAHLSSRYDISR